MNWSSRKKWMVRIGATAVALAVGASASAGTLYSWKTDDGTFAYTDDKRRIPARYKAAVRTSKLESMQSYSRYTPGPKTDGRAHAERITARLEALRGVAGGPMSSGGEEPVGRAASVTVGLGGSRGAGSDAQIEIPIRAGMADTEPVVIEHVRMRAGAGHSTTRHFRVVKQGDRVLAVIKDRNHNRRPTGLDPADFDSSPLE